MVLLGFHVLCHADSDVLLANTISVESAWQHLTMQA